MGYVVPIVRGGHSTAAVPEVKDESVDIFSPVNPKYCFSDIIVSDEVRNSIFDVLAIRDQSKFVFEEWGLSNTHKNNNKVAINFYGVPGTGKTMAAHAVADHYGKEIIEVSYADIESKYVGDTPKNLKKVFEVAQQTGSVLFFDEADAMLSRRVTSMKSSTDTSVNQTRSVLLMLLDDYEGVVVFATNFISNFDPAFMRRIVGHVEMVLPDFETRVNLWNKMIPKELPNTLDVNRIAQKFDDVSGSDISNAVLKAAFKAARSGLPKVPHDFFEDSLVEIKNSLDLNSGCSVVKRKVSKDYVSDAIKMEEL